MNQNLQADSVFSPIAQEAKCEEIRRLIAARPLVAEPRNFEGLKKWAAGWARDLAYLTLGIGTAWCAGILFAAILFSASGGLR